MSSKVDTATRLRRLFAILGWLVQVGEAPIDEVAARFNLTPAALVADLEMAACCGVPPYTPDELLEIVVTDETVSTRVGTTLSRPRRLSPGEGLALAASARALLSVPGSDENGALSRALSKLDIVLGQVAVAVELDSPEFLDEVRTASSSGQRLTITYYTATTDTTSERTITPMSLFASEGHWYVDAWCETAGSLRRFRVDRISAATPAGPASPDILAAGAPGPDAAGGSSGSGGADGDADGDQARLIALGAYVPGPESRRVRIAVDESATWLLESIPSAKPLEPEGGRPVWEVFVGGDAWLERLLLRLGPAAVVIDPADYRSLAADAAARILERYQSAET